MITCAPCKPLSEQKATIPFATRARSILVMCALLCVTVPALRGSTITEPGVIILLNGGNASISWDATIAGPAILEQSENLTDWTPISSNNTAGNFVHPVGNLTKSFYRLRAEAMQAQSMIIVQGGTLATSNGLNGTVVSTFEIGKYEVRWDEWQEMRTWALANGYGDFTTGNGSAADHPVRNVNWYDVVKYCNARSEREGLVPVYSVNGTVYQTGEFGWNGSSVVTRNLGANGYRLPTEAEWEWAARGGVSSQGYTYSGGNDVDAVAWTYENSIGPVVILWDGRGTWPVGQKAANELSIYDMSGNVWEWCEDLVSGAHRRIRGGRWNIVADYAAVADRDGNRNPGYRNTYIGFRVARSSEL
jgi:hypothetical protein